MATTYYACIDSSGKVSTRDNLHDFLNTLIWIAFPSIKVQLNALQAVELAKDGTQSGSSKPRGAVTIFDENATPLLVRTYKAITSHTLVVSPPERVFMLENDPRRTWIDTPCCRRAGPARRAGWLADAAAGIDRAGLITSSRSRILCRHRGIPTKAPCLA